MLLSRHFLLYSLLLLLFSNLSTGEVSCASSRLVEELKEQQEKLIKKSKILNECCDLNNFCFV